MTGRGSAMLVRKALLQGGSVLRHEVTHAGRDRHCKFSKEIVNDRQCPPGNQLDPQGITGSTTHDP